MVVSLAALAAVGGATLSGTTAVASDDGDDGDGGGRTVLAAKTMAGVPTGYTGTTAPIRGVNGGGAPWTIDRADVRLTSDGSLRVRVRGLVLGNEAPVPLALRGTNPVPFFKALLSCQSTQNGVATVVNVSTDPFPATTAGDSDMRAHVAIADPCLAPIIFVTSPTGAWFAVTGTDG